MKLHHLIESVIPEVESAYRHIHQHPELGMQEVETSAFVESLLKKTSVDRIQRVGETGLLAEIKGLKPGSQKAIILRGDMDALPILESDRHTLRSQNHGVMHACGHDVHTSVLYGAVRVLEQFRQDIEGSVLFMFQPAEETLKGAKLFINDPAVDFSHVEGAVACHVGADLYGGTIGIRNGPILASSDLLTIKIKGKNGHAAYPHAAVDSIVAASQVVLALQALISRETSPTDSAVLSVCTIHGGTAFNIIAGEVVLEGTLRTVRPETRARLHGRIEEVCVGIAGSMGATAELSVEIGPPPFVNDSEWFARADRVGKKLLGAEKVIHQEEPSLAAEDFTYIREKFPGIFIHLGARSQGGPHTPVHTPEFICDTGAFYAGVAALSGMALDFFDVDFE